MSVHEDYIFCNRVLHDQFFAIAEILGLIVAISPGPVSISQIKRDTNRSTNELRQICLDLADVRLLTRKNGKHDQWLLNADPASLTLEDVYVCLMQAQARRMLVNASDDSPPVEQGRFQSTVDMFIMQATMGLNQSTRSHLRGFSLARLKVGAQALNPWPGKVLRMRRGPGAGTVAADLE